ncbi:hypothetical protein JW756_06880 [Candidatus Woesearchaeota archaeon]|nr:hypothetical protein [Candidatus Woesearchaeota archaeon]
MNKLFLYVLVGILLATSVFAAEKSEFVQLVENTYHCFDCWTVYKITKADDVSLDKFGLDFKDVDGDFVLPDYDIGYLTSETYSELVDIYEPCVVTKTIVNNETDEEETVNIDSTCYAGQQEVEKTREYYVFSSGDPMGALKGIKAQYNAAAVGDTIYIKVTGHPERGTSLDNILTLNDYTYDEYAWWNANFTYRLNISCSQVSDGFPIVVNGSNGFSLGGYQQIVWVACQNNTGLAVYYNNYSSYILANNSVQVPFEVERGNASSYNSVQAWDYFNRVNSQNNSNSPYIFHLNSNNTVVDSISVNSGYSNLTQSKGMVDGGLLSDGSETSTKLLSYHDIHELVPGNMTIMFIFNGTTLLSNENYFMHNYDGTNYYVLFAHSTGYIDISFVSSGNLDFRFTPTSAVMTNGSKHLIVISKVPGYNVNNFTSYFDGAIYNKSSLIDTLSATTSTTNQVWGRRTQGDFPINFTLDEVRVLNYTMSASEVNMTWFNLLGVSGYGSLGVGESYPGPDIVNESSGRTAIIAGVDASEIASSYSAYYDKQVYERLANGSQYKGTFDVFVVSGNKRWAFNYDQNTSSSFPVFFNITPVFYVWQNYNQSYSAIVNSVQALIDSTN